MKTKSFKFAKSNKWLATKGGRCIANNNHSTKTSYTEMPNFITTASEGVM